MPSILIVPSDGVSNPASILSRVVFPDPEAPNIENSSPLFISRSTLSTAAKSPKYLLMPLISI